jgi:hypothetical protein
MNKKSEEIEQLKKEKSEEIKLFFLFFKKTMEKRKKYNSNFDSNAVLCCANSGYAFLKDLKDLIILDFKLENFNIPTLLLQEVIVDLETTVCFVINLTFVYDVIRLLC